MADLTTAKLTPKQRLFVHEYLIDLNATQAALRAGYSPNTAGSIGDENLKKPKIKALVDAAMAKRVARLELSQDRTILEILRIAMSDLRGVADWEGRTLTLKSSDEITDDMAAAISEIRETKDGISVKLHAKAPMLKLLADHFGITRGDPSGDLPRLVVGLLEHIDRDHYLTPEHRELNPANEVGGNGKDRGNGIPE